MFYVVLETSSKTKLICVPTHYYWSIPFSAVNFLSFSFSHICQYLQLRYYLYIVLLVPPSKVFVTI